MAAQMAHILLFLASRHQKLMLLQKESRPSSSGPCSLHVFQLFLRQYAYCQEHDRFEAVSPVPAQLPTLLLQALATLQAINKGVGCYCITLCYTTLRICSPLSRGTLRKSSDDRFLDDTYHMPCMVACIRVFYIHLPPPALAPPWGVGG